MKTTYLGEFEYVVLLAVLQVEGAYAVPIRRMLEERTGRPIARGALYTALERLETKGCLRSTMGEPLPERGGRARRYFTVSPTGLRALRNSRRVLLGLWDGLESKLGTR
jgi:PadR family transcriptional regulator